MDHKLDRRSLVLMAAIAGLVPSLLQAQEASSEEPTAELPDLGVPFGPVPASEISEADELFVRRPVIVFADNPHDPNFIRQMEILPDLYPQLTARDVVLITDTDPATPSEIRRKLRPRGFSLVMMDKDWRSPVRRPSPRAAREIINTIDKMPIARTEALEKNPAGR
ncbi:DUF4174 domain-containing protein [Pseudomonas sp. GX19020]|uniref:DUF4174 domain-containing protein n=1 Tax=Pseudomonas sp. GX19020 TaxID=2942277 RepID=UPI002018BDF8|nr:DUF4174 domain-containing protein [Pseudomonas sp. GX19020]MCL4066807.1 DUF4174 domain-containing protein [Pseudomonas sp. GX19020]